MGNDPLAYSVLVPHRDGCDPITLEDIPERSLNLLQFDSITTQFCLPMKAVPKRQPHPMSHLTRSPVRYHVCALGPASGYLTNEVAVAAGLRQYSRAGLSP